MTYALCNFSTFALIFYNRYVGLFDHKCKISSIISEIILWEKTVFLRKRKGVTVVGVGQILFAPFFCCILVKSNSSNQKCYVYLITKEKKKREKERMWNGLYRHWTLQSLLTVLISVSWPFSQEVKRGAGG